MGMECGPNPLVAYIKDVFFLIPHKNVCLEHKGDLFYEGFVFEIVLIPVVRASFQGFLGHMLRLGRGQSSLFWGTSADHFRDTLLSTYFEILSAYFQNSDVIIRNFILAPKVPKTRTLRR